MQPASGGGGIRRHRPTLVGLSLGTLLVALAIALAVPSVAGVLTKTKRVSVSSAEVQGNNGSYNPSISADGRFVAFGSDATNLVGGDTNGWEDVFVRDRRTGKTRRVNLSSAGAQGNDHSFNPSISADGRLVAFGSSATNLVGNDTNGFDDVFVRDRRTGKTRRVSVSSAGTQGDGGNFNPSTSSDGRFVGFESFAANLVGGDTNGFEDIFVRGPLH
jgi:Tol biopolymer transport system component